MEPVRIRLYGLVSTTKRGYLIQLVAEVVLILGLTLLNVFYLSRLPSRPTEPLPPLLAWTVFLLDNLHWFIVALAVLVALEAYLVMKAFDRAEAAQKAKVQP